MKTLTLSLFLCVYFSPIFAVSHTTNTINSNNSVYQQLCELNKYWVSQESYQNLLSQKVYFQDHEDLIQLHLRLVESHLRQKDVSHLSSSQQKNRKEALQVLRQYWQKKQFPKNTRHSTITPYFIDDFNTACAVGHLMRESGATEQAHFIAQTMNNAYIDDMPLEELQQWAEKMGFEVDELKWIQPSYGIFADIDAENDADCGTRNGSIITNIFPSWGCFETEESYIWYDYSNKHIKRIGTTQNLENAPSGFYRFQVNYSNNGDLFYQCRPMRFGSINDSNGFDIDVSIEPNSDSPDHKLTLHIKQGTPPYRIEWFDFNENYLGNGIVLNQIQGYTYPNDGTFIDYTHRVKVVDANGCKAFGSIYVEDFESMEIPVPLFTPHLRNAIEGRAEGSIHIETSMDCTYEWSHDSSLNSEMATGLAEGNYTVSITEVESQKTYIRHFTILEEVATDIEDDLLESLNIYPTFTTEYVHIDLPKNVEECKLEVFDNSGRIVESTELPVSGADFSLETYSYPSGMYFVSIVSRGSKYTGKFVRQ